MKTMHLLLSHICCRKYGRPENPEPLYCKQELVVQVLDRAGKPHEFSFCIDPSLNIEDELIGMGRAIAKLRKSLSKKENYGEVGVPPGWGEL